MVQVWYMKGPRIAYKLGYPVKKGFELLSMLNLAILQMHQCA